jgi:putative peptidoglycan lipid II flippase
LEKNRIIRSAFLIGGFTLMSRGLGLVRDFLTAGFFGTSLAMSAFVVAFRIPNLFRALFGEGALSSAFIPVFMATRKNEGDAEAWVLARKVISLVGVVLLGVVLLGVTGLTIVMRQPDLGEKTAMILPLARIMLPYMMFICLAALSMAILNSYHQFSIPASTPSLLNLTWIAFILLIVPHIEGPLEVKIYGVAWGVFVAGIIQLLYQLPALLHYGYRPGFRLDLKDARVLRVFTLMGPAALGLAITQVNVMVNSLLAVWIGSWAPAALFYAERLLYFPQGILATAMSTVLLPVLSGHAAHARHQEIRETINHSLRTLLFVMAPASIGLLTLAHPIVQMIFEWGHFTQSSTDLTAIALQFYAPGLFVFCLAKVFVPAFYALQDTRTPVKIGLMAVGLNFTLNVLFILTWPLYYKHAGLAMATVISEGFNGITLALLLRKRLGPLGLKTILVTVGRALSASVVMGILAIFIRSGLHDALLQFGLHAKIAQVTSVLLAILLGGLIYLAIARLLRFPELNDVIQAVRERRKRKSRPQ